MFDVRCFGCGFAAPCSSVNLPALSVAIPNYNHAQYLPRCLESILRQSVQPSEILVLDDCSTDNSIEVLQDFARRHPQIRVHRNERNLGAVGNINQAFELARGEYLFVPSADDEVVPGFFEKSLRLLAQYPQAALSCTIAEWHDVDSGLKWHMGSGMAETPCYLAPDELVRLGRKGKLIICTSSVILKKEALRQAGGYIPELRWHVDWFATAVMAFRNGLCHVPEPLSNFYLHSTSYYHKGRASGEHVQVLARLMDKLRSPAYADVAPRVRDSAMLSLFGLTIMGLMLRRPEYRWFLTPRLLVRASRRSVELVGKRILPRPLARLCLRLLYHHRSAPGQRY